MLTELHKKELQSAINLGSNYQVMISADLLRAIEFELNRLSAFEQGSYSSWTSLHEKQTTSITNFII